MLSEKFLTRLSGQFPTFYARVDEEARTEAARLRIQAQGDISKALARARLEGAARLWWPYVKGSLPLVRPERDAMEAFSRLILTVDHIVGHEPGSMEHARDHVLQVLRDSLDVERLKELIDQSDKKSKKDDAAAAAAGAGIMASATALMAPLTMLRNARRFSKWIPGWGKIVAGAIVVGALASVPLVAGYSAGRKAEDAARQAHTPTEPIIDADLKRAA